MLHSSVVREETDVAGTEGVTALMIAEEIWEADVDTTIDVMMIVVDLLPVNFMTTEILIAVDRLLDIEGDRDLVRDLLLDIVQEVLVETTTMIDLAWVAVPVEEAVAVDRRHHLEDLEVSQEEVWVVMTAGDTTIGIMDEVTEIVVIVVIVHDPVFFF